MRFTKMHGIGNDFVVMDAVTEELPAVDYSDLSQRVCERKFGVGADGLIVIVPSKIGDIGMRMFNPDGSEAEMCGNGVRCVARYAHERRLTDGSTIRLETAAGIRTLKVNTKKGTIESVRVDMGRPILERAGIPMRGAETERAIDEPLRVAGRRLKFTAVSMGNPHAVIFDAGTSPAIVEQLGPPIEQHRLFPKRTNVQFVEIQSTSEAVLATWERGAGATLACGTGACAALVAGVLTGRLGRRALLHLPGGDLEVEWAGDDRVWMTGPAVEVFVGEYPG